jgi:hypothetical protein
MTAPAAARNPRRDPLPKPKVVFVIAPAQCPQLRASSITSATKPFRNQRVTSTMPPKEQEESECATLVAPHVAENVSFPISEGRAAPLRSSGTTRCAGKTHVFGYEPGVCAARRGKREFFLLRRPSSSSSAHQAPHAAQGRLTSSATSLEPATLVAPHVAENVSFPISEGRAALLPLTKLHTLRVEDS